MIIKRGMVSDLINAITIIKENNELPLTAKYYLIKIYNILAEEEEIVYSLYKELKDKYGEEDIENGIKIKEEYAEEVAKQIAEFNEEVITLPDVRFNLSDFEDSNLTWEQLSALVPFIKE